MIKKRTSYEKATSHATFYAAHALTSGILSMAEGALSPFTGPVFRAAAYDGNRIGYTVCPPPEVLIRLYYSGRFGLPSTQGARQKLWNLLAEHGIHNQADVASSIPRAEAWQSAVNLEMPLPDIDVALRAWRLGGFGMFEGGVDDLLGRHGIWQANYRDMIKKLPEPLTVDEIVRLWAAGIIDEATVKRLLSYGGLPEGELQDYIRQLYEVPSLEESFILRNREVITDTELREYLGRMGFRRDEEKDRLAGLRLEIPGPSDLVRFAVRHVFEPSLATKFGFDEEISDDFVEWHKKQGFGMAFNITDPIDGQQYPMNWAKAHWWAHWVWPSPTQAYTMLHRLRPTGGVNNGPRDANGLVFTANDLGLLLRGNDYPPHWRPYLGTISFRVIETSQIKQATQAGIFDDKEAEERYQDVGYTKADSKILVDLVNKENEWQRLQKLTARIRFKTIQAYKHGVVSKQSAGTLLYGLALPTLAKYNEYTNKPVAEQQKIATDDAITQGVLGVIDTDLDLEIANKAIAAIKKSFMRFNIDANQALQALTQIGVFQTRAQQMINGWQWEFYGQGKEFSVGQVVKALVRGAILPAVALIRLLKLGYRAVDAQVLIQIALQDRQVYLTRLATQKATSLAKQQKALIQQQKMIQKQLADAQHALARSASKEKLLKWFKKGYIPLAEFELRLSVLGVKPEDIQHFVQEGKADAKKNVAATAGS